MFVVNGWVDVWESELLIRGRFNCGFFILREVKGEFFVGSVFWVFCSGMNVVLFRYIF